MTTRRLGLALPERAEALDIIHGFNEINPGEIADYRLLAGALHGLSSAVSSVAIEYGETYPLPHVRVNVGLRALVGEGVYRHEFGVTDQGSVSLSPAHIWRCDTHAEKSEFYDSVKIPQDEVLQRFLNTDPKKLSQDWHPPMWADIYAKRVRGQILFPARVYEIYKPFDRPLEISKDRRHTPEEGVKNYAQILQELSRTLIEIVE